MVPRASSAIKLDILKFVVSLDHKSVHLTIETGTKIQILMKVYMPDHVSIFMLNVLCVGHDDWKWASKSITSISFFPPPLPLKSEMKTICHVVQPCAITQVPVSKHRWIVFRLQEVYFTSRWEWELLDMKGSQCVFPLKCFLPLKFLFTAAAFHHFG